MRFPSAEIIDSTFAAPSHVSCRKGGFSPLAVQSSAAVAKPAQDRFSGLNGCKEARSGLPPMVHKPEDCGLSHSYVCRGTQPYIQKNYEAIHCSQPNLFQRNGSLHCTQQTIQQKDEAVLTEALPASHKNVEGHEPASSSSSSSFSSSLSSERVPEAKTGVEASMMTSMPMAEKMAFAHPCSSEQIAKANLEGETSKPTSMAMAGKLVFTHPSSSERVPKAEETSWAMSMPMAGVLGSANPTLAWGQALMWPWLWPYIFNSAAMAGGVPHVDQAAVSAAWASAATAAAAANVTSFLQFPPAWSPYGWGVAPWNVALNVNNPAAVESSIAAAGKRPRSPSHEQEPLCIPKTLKLGHPEEAVHSSILTTLGLASLPTTSPASVTGFLNANFQPKAEVLQHKPAMAQVPQQHLEPQRPHTNPAAQARSLAFQENN